MIYYHIERNHIHALVSADFVKPCSIYHEIIIIINYCRKQITVIVSNVLAQFENKRSFTK